MRVLVIGIGLQGRAVVHDLDRSPKLEQVIAADVNEAVALREVERLGCNKTRAVGVDARDTPSVRKLIIDSGARLVVCMVPPADQITVAAAAVQAGAHFVSTSYKGALADLDGEARASGLVLLPEIGLDPGIDLVMARAAVDALHEVRGIRMYGGGIPEPDAADNPLRYRVTWTFEGVLRSYRRAARMLRDGQPVAIGPEAIFNPEHVHTVQIDEVGDLEAYPNGDALRYLPELQLGSGVREISRFTLRWPGHCALWRSIAGLGLLDDEIVAVGAERVSKRTLLARMLEPRLAYEPTQRDIALLRVDAWGVRDAVERTVRFELVDRRDLETGFFAMNRTVGYSAAIAAQMIAAGEISKPGLRSPARDIVPARMFDELAARGIRVVQSTPL